VRDRGPGVPPAQRERIFDSFRQGEGADRGAGVGLALCRAVAQAHGGELTLRPRGHGGASFELWLPIEAAPT
jgi:two-component system sensor histidine kinase KdpD